MLRFKCPKCEKPLGVKEQLAGKKVACPHCKAPFTVPAPKSKAAVDGNGASTAPVMGILTGSPAAREPSLRVSFSCPHCHEKLKIPVDLAGKQKPCPRCKKPFTIPPADELKKLAASPALEASQGGVDLEDLAASALSGPEAKPDEAPKEQQKIDVICSWCDEKVQFDIELGGKQAQCPACRNIVKVPKVEYDRPTDWRERKATGPSLAKETKKEVLEGAWGTATDRGAVHRDTLEETGAIVAEAEPIRPTVWVRRVLIAVALVALGVITFTAARYVQMNTQEEKALKAAQESFKKVELKMPNRAWAAAYYLGLGEFFARKDEAGEVYKAQKNFKSAFAVISASLSQKAPLTLEEEILLADLAVAQLQLGGSEDQARLDTKIRWTELVKDLNQTLKTIGSNEGKLLALRHVSLRLLDLKQEGIALSLAAQVGSAGAGESKGLLQAEQVALLTALKKADQAKELLPPPDLAKITEISKAARLAYAQAAAYEGNFDGAKEIAQAKGAASDKLDKLQTYLAIADIALAKKNANEAKANLDEAKKFAAEVPKSKDAALLLFQLASLLARTGSPEEAENWMKQIPNAGCKALAHLEILKAVAAKSKQALDPLSLESAKSLAYALAVMESARQKTRQGSQKDLEETAETQDEFLRPLIYLGIALGTQDNHKSK